MAYTDLLKKPQWQKKRLEVMNLHDWKCLQCGDTESMLTVHHKYYDKRLMPWEYPIEAYETLCYHCHNDWHNVEKEFWEDVKHCLVRSKFDLTDDIYSLVQTLSVCQPAIRTSDLILYIRHILLNQPEHIKALENLSNLSLKQRAYLSLIQQHA